MRERARAHTRAKERTSESIEVGVWALLSTVESLTRSHDSSPLPCVFTPLPSYEEAFTWRARHEAPLLVELALLNARDDPEGDLRLLAAPAQRTILLGRVTPAEMRGLLRVARVPNTELYLPDVEPLSLLIERTAGGATGASSEAATRLLRSNVREVIKAALESPGDWTVKRMVAEAACSRRSLERHLKRVGLPSPAALLRP